MTAPILNPLYFRRPLQLSPRYSQRPWGGRGLKTVLGKDLPGDDSLLIGESWELSDHPDGRSTIGENTFGDLVRAYPKEMIGRDSAPAKYPILVKYIDAQGDLSVQVHPDDAWCAAHGHDDRGKSECWYVMDCKPGTKVIYGFKRAVTEAEVREALAAGKIEELLDFRPIKPGDFLALPPGCVHAMLSGTLVCEIQQSSNTTFRLYDWNRQPPRELHIDQSMEVSKLDPSAMPSFQHYGEIGARGEDEPVSHKVLLDNEFFRVLLTEIAPSCSIASAGLRSETGTILNVVAGSGSMVHNGEKFLLKRGDTYFLPAAMQQDPSLQANGDGLRVLSTISHEI